MSTILDALRKLERDKKIDAAHGRPADPLAPAPMPALSPQADRRRGAGTWLVVGALLTFGAGIGFGLWTGEQDEAPRPGLAAADATAVRPLARAVTPPPVDRAASIEREPAQVAAPSIERVPDQLAAPSIEREPAQPTAPSIERPVVSTVPDVAASPPKPEPVAVATPPKPKPVAVATPPKPAPVAVASARSPKPAPVAVTHAPKPAASEARDVPAVEEAARPGLADVVVGDAAMRREVIVVKTIWHPKPERRSAQIRFQPDGEPIEVREVEIVEGFRVEAITPSSVVLAKDGVSATYRVGR